MNDLWPWIVIGIGLLALTVRAVRDFLWRTVVRRSASVDSERPPTKKDVRGRRKEASDDVAHLWMPITLSLLVVLSALYVILSKDTYPDAQQKWAFGAVGMVLGHWLKR